MLIVVNLSPVLSKTVTLATLPGAGAKAGAGAGANGTKQQWLLQAAGASAGIGNASAWAASKRLALNGAEVGLSAAGEAPRFLPPRIAAATEPTVLPPLSVALVQFDDYGAAGCR